jgi:hypothetical protein
MNANSRMFKELRRGETWVVSDNNNRRRRRRRRKEGKGLYGSGCMFASCPGDPFFDNTMKFDFLSSFFFLGCVRQSEKGRPKEPHQILSNTHNNQQQQHKDFNLHINVELTPYDLKVLCDDIFSCHLFFFFLSFYLTSLSPPPLPVSSNTR